MVLMIERYGVYWVRLDPVQGSEIAKTRPAVVISDDDMNRFLDTVVVCPLTSRLHHRWPSRIQTTIAGSPAEIAIDQIRAVDKTRIGTRLDSLDASAETQVRHVITRMYGVLAIG
jgi:mRNA interferase MazF